VSNEITQSVAYDNYDDFQHINVLFSQNFISLFLGLFNDETYPRVRYSKPKLVALSLTRTFTKEQNLFKKE
jgi:hypothetical protein